MAHSLATLEAARERVAFVLNKTNADSNMVRALRRSLTEPRHSETLRTWLKARHGRAVDTAQIDIALGDTAEPVGIGGVWVPLRRVLDAMSRATYATLDGSRRDYRGMTTFHADSTAWMGFTDSLKPGHVQLVIYTCAPKLAPGVHVSSLSTPAREFAERELRACGITGDDLEAALVSRLEDLRDTLPASTIDAIKNTY